MRESGATTCAVEIVLQTQIGSVDGGFGGSIDGKATSKLGPYMDSASGGRVEAQLRDSRSLYRLRLRGAVTIGFARSLSALLASYSADFHAFTLNSDPRIDTLLKAGRPLRSLEFFPPKDDAGVEALRQTATALKAISPAFVSITYGAGGGTRERTAQMSAMLRNEFGFAVMPHLTCVNHTRDEIRAITAAHHANGIRNIMALRGDVPKGLTVETAFKDGLRYGCDIVGLLHEAFPDICCGVGGYPEKHPEAAALDGDIENLKRKVDAGAAFITTQLFFDNAVYYRFVDLCRARGITIPILPGIMPVQSLKQVKRMIDLSGGSLPYRLSRRLEVAGESTDAVEFIGIEWAVTQIRDLLAQGAPGYHLYILNRAKGALALAASLAA